MMPSLTRDQAQAAVVSAAAEREAIQANLLDLDGSFGKRLLAGASALTGQTRRQWETTSAGLASLWEKFSAYAAVIDRAGEILATPGRLHPARLAEAVELLRGPSVVVATPVSPLGQRELTAGGERRLTPAGAVAEMKREFPQVASLLTAAEEVWTETSDGLRLAGDALAEARSQAPGFGDADLASSLALAEAGLRDLRDVLNSDPLALWHDGLVDTARLARLREQAAAVTARVAELASARDEADQRIAEVSATVSAARQAWQDAMAARERAAARIFIANLAPLPNVAGLGGRLDGLAELRAAGRWTRLASELELLGKQAGGAAKACREAERAAVALLERRDELRGLLDAYRAKAGRLGAAEDAGLASRYRQAHDLLWTAPSDLAAAAAAISDYQRAVLELGRGGERA